MANTDPIYSRVLVEQNQSHDTRKSLFTRLEQHLQRPVVSFFSNMSYGVLSNADADMLQSILQTMDLSKGLALVINSPGGDGIAAERIINVCRTLSGTGEFWAIVPGKAKSAATMICFGASKIFMSRISELGPVDPQIMLPRMRLKMFSVHNIVKTYDTLFQEAVSEDKGNLEPYLQQLERFDAGEIGEFRAAIKLSEDIAVRSLKSEMMNGSNDREIKEKIKIFTVPDQVLSHARPIGIEEAIGCGLSIEPIDVKDKWWKLLHELYIRSDNYVSTGVVAKCMESKLHAFHAPGPQHAPSPQMDWPTGEDEG